MIAASSLLSGCSFGIPHRADSERIAAAGAAAAHGIGETLFDSLVDALQD